MLNKLAKYFAIFAMICMFLGSIMYFVSGNYGAAFGWGFALVWRVEVFTKTDYSDKKPSGLCDHGFENWDDCPVCGH